MTFFLDSVSGGTANRVETRLHTLSLDALRTSIAEISRLEPSTSSRVAIVACVVS
jgi:hypothetical protein